jgi:hypothetical protein
LILQPRGKDSTIKARKAPETIKPLSTLITLIIGGLASGAAASANADTVIYDNLGAASTGVEQIAYFGPLFDSFTPTSNESITGLQLALGSFQNFTPSGALNIGLYTLSDLTSLAVPTLIAPLGNIQNSTIPSSSSSGSIEDYSVSLLDNPVLTAGTRYWIGLSDFADGAVYWSWSTDTSGPGVAGEYWAYGGGVVEPNSEGPFQMELSVAGVPDAPNTASMLALCAAGLAILAWKGGFRPFVRPARGSSD